MTASNSFADSRDRTNRQPGCLVFLSIPLRIRGKYILLCLQKLSIEAFNSFADSSCPFCGKTLRLTPHFQFLCGFELKRSITAEIVHEICLSIPLRIRESVTNKVLPASVKPFQFLCGFEIACVVMARQIKEFPFNSFADSSGFHS